MWVRIRLVAVGSSHYNGKRICLASGFKEHVTVELFYGARLQDAQGRIVGWGRIPVT